MSRVRSLVPSRRNLARIASGLAAGSLVGLANAAAIDASAVVTEIGAQGTPIANVGAAVLLIIVGILAFKWLRKAL